MIEQSIVHLPELVKDIERPVSIYLVHLSSVRDGLPIFTNVVEAAFFEVWMQNPA
jgi:hypothetical protein